MVEPLRPLFDEVVCAALGVDEDGRFTGQLEQLPPTGEARALCLAEYADNEGLDLSESVAYADSASDLPLLECVGFPVAVNPEARLAAIARRRGWHTEQWDRAAGGGRPLLPLGPLDRGASRWWDRLEDALDAIGAGRSPDAERTTSRAGTRTRRSATDATRATGTASQGRSRSERLRSHR